MIQYKFNNKFFLLLFILLLGGCGTNQQKLQPSLSSQTLAKAINSPTPLAITAFEKICINNASSADEMIKAAKAYSVGNVTTKTHRFKGESVSVTSMMTTDNTLEFVIYAPTMNCQVRASTGKSLIISALFLDSYNDEAKMLDVKLGIMLVNKFGNSITVSREVKNVSGPTNNRVISYGPTYARYDNGKLIRYSLKPKESQNILDLSHE